MEKMSKKHSLLKLLSLLVIVMASLSLVIPVASAKEPASAGKPEAKTAPAPQTDSKAGKQEVQAKLVPGEKVNINAAGKQKLEALPGIGPVKAQAIIDDRPYNTLEDIMRVPGIKRATFNRIKDMISVK